MSLKEKLLNDMKDAMRDKDKIRKDTVQLIRSAILQIEKDKHITLEDEGIVEVLVKELKSRRDALADIEKSGRTELIDNCKKEIEIIQQYMPAQLTEEEVEAIVSEAVKESGATTAKDMGKVMKLVMPKVKGKADGNLVNAVVKRILG